MMKTTGTLMIAVAVTYIAAVASARTNGVSVDPPQFEVAVGSLEEGFAYVGLQPPGSDIRVDPPTITASLPSLEEGFALPILTLPGRA